MQDGERAEDALPSPAQIAAFVASSPGKVGAREIARAFGLKGQQKSELKTALIEMQDGGTLARRGRRVRAAGGLPPVFPAAIVARDRDGEFLAEPLGWDEDGPAPRIVIQQGRRNPKHREKPAGIGDHVLLRIDRSVRGSEPVGRIVKLLPKERATTLGVFKAHPAGGGRILSVDKKALGRELLVRPGDEGDAQDGDLVSVTVARSRDLGPLGAKVRERLGSLASERAVSLVAIHTHAIPHIFSPETLAEAEKARPATLKGREDWRALPLVTIDPPDAKDHDDAVHAAPDEDPANPGGHVVTVAIADVAAYVREGSALDGEALEKLAEVDLAVFDKTGTLSVGRPELVGHDADARTSMLAAALAASSRHPLSQALAAAFPAADAPLLEIVERPGLGVEATDAEGRLLRLGSAAFCNVSEGDDAARQPGPQAHFSIDGAPVACFRFTDALRDDARDVIAQLHALGLETAILSGDRRAAVAAAAKEAGVAEFEAELSPAEKLARLEEWAQAGRKLLMVGDGVNDAPSLARAFVSASPAAAADVSRTAADLVFFGERLTPVLDALRIARAARRRAIENFAMAALYNLIAIPIAVAGMATPIVAALAMSSSSVIVTLNAMRLARPGAAAARAKGDLHDQSSALDPDRAGARRPRARGLRVEPAQRPV